MAFKDGRPDSDVRVFKIDHFCDVHTMVAIQTKRLNGQFYM